MAFSSVNLNRSAYVVIVAAAAVVAVAAVIFVVFVWKWIMNISVADANYLYVKYIFFVVVVVAVIYQIIWLKYYVCKFFSIAFFVLFKNEWKRVYQNRMNEQKLNRMKGIKSNMSEYERYFMKPNFGV